MAWACDARVVCLLCYTSLLFPFLQVFPFFCLAVQKCFFFVSGAGWFVSVYVAVVLRLLSEFYTPSPPAMKFMLCLRTYSHMHDTAPQGWISETVAIEYH